MRDDHPGTDPDAETTEIRETPASHGEVHRTSTLPPDDPESRNWVGYALIAFVLLLLLFSVWWMNRDDDDAENVRDVEVTQTETEVVEDEDEGLDDDAGGGDDTGGGVDTADTGDTVVQEGDTVIIERATGGNGTGAEATAEGGDVVVQRRRDGGAAEVDVTIADSRDLEQFDDARIRIPTGTQLAVKFENDSDKAYNAYLKPGSGGNAPTLASMEPFVKANSTREESFTTPAAGGTYTVRVEDQDGNTVFEATFELEER